MQLGLANCVDANTNPQQLFSEWLEWGLGSKRATIGKNFLQENDYNECKFTELKEHQYKVVKVYKQEMAPESGAHFSS